MPRPRVPRRRAPRGPGGPARGHRPPPPRAQPGSGAIDPAGSPREQHADVLVPGALPTGLLDEPSPHEPPHVWRSPGCTTIWDSLEFVEVELEGTAEGTVSRSRLIELQAR